MLKVEIFYIILGLFIGFLVVYILTPTPNIVFKYPNAEQIQNKIFNDNGQCYQYQLQKINCPRK